MLNVMADAVEGSNAAGFGKGGGCEGDVDASEESLGDEVAAC